MGKEDTNHCLETITRRFLGGGFFFPGSHLEREYFDSLDKSLLGECIKITLNSQDFFSPLRHR